MPEFPAIEDTLFSVFEKRAEHHHRNKIGDGAPTINFDLLLSVEPELLGVRIKILDEYRDGTAAVDVAIQYYWKSEITPEDSDNLNKFVERIAIPQVLACASSTLIDTARAITDEEVPFYGVSALGRMINSFRERKRPLSEILEESIARRAAVEKEHVDE